MTRELRVRTVGEVVEEVRDHEKLGRAFVALFPGVGDEMQTDIPEQEALDAGFTPERGYLFTAVVDHNALEPGELKPSDLDVLLKQPHELPDDLTQWED